MNEIPRCKSIFKSGGEAPPRVAVTAAWAAMIEQLESPSAAPHADRTPRPEVRQTGKDGASPC